MAGRLDVDRMLRQLTPKQLREWGAYYELEPFDHTPAKYHAALICQTMANIHRGKNQTAYKLGQFLLEFDATSEKPKEQTVQEKLNVMTVIMKAYAMAAAENAANAARAAETAAAHGVDFQPA